MSNKPAKRSNFTREESISRVLDYLKTIDDDILEIITYLDRFPRQFEQSAEPSIQRNTHAFWRDLDDEKFYLLKDFGGVTKKVELT